MQTTQERRCNRIAGYRVLLTDVNKKKIADKARISKRWTLRHNCSKVGISHRYIERTKLQTKREFPSSKEVDVTPESLESGY